MVPAYVAIILMVLGLIVGTVAGYKLSKQRWLPWQEETTAADLLGVHFAPTQLKSLSVVERTFPSHVRPDLQRTLDCWETTCKIDRFSGVSREYAWMGTSFSDLVSDDGANVAKLSPPRREEVDIGEDVPVPCLENGLWAFEADGVTGALFVSHGADFPGQPAHMKFALATTSDEQASKWSQDFFRKLELAVAEAGSYRGKVLSFDVEESYAGTAVGLNVMRLREVERDEVILPMRTLALLERNVLKFAERRSRLAEAGLSTKKGLLFHGPPGTGKTHTIHYLARALAGHTTLVITAEQIQYLSSYMTLARLLQPSMVVMEDADLIARNRDDADNPCAEVLLNKLLNEMDGLQEDAEILFVLTTNRPDALEPALAARPGRIDQAIEFPLPDLDGRRKLIKLYAAGLQVTEDDVENLAKRTEGVSAAFIKELMRRSMQYHLEHEDSPQLSWSDITEAMDEMLVHGGSINLKLLGADVGTEHGV